MNTTDYNELYAALKLIECLYKKGLIKKHVYKNILLEYQGKIDITDFKVA